MTSNFYATAAILDALKETFSPTREQVHMCETIIRQPGLLRYFFHDLTNPNWLPPLAQAGIFHLPPAPEETEPGYYRIPGWEASRYLVRVADSHPQLVAHIALTIRTANFRVHNDLVDAAVRMPAKYAAVMEPAVASWLDGPFRASLPEKAADLMVYLGEHEEPEAAVDLLQALMSPADQKPGLVADTREPRQPEEIRSKFDEWQLDQIVRGQVQKIAATYPNRVVAVLENKLVAAIYGEADEQGAADPTRFSFWAEDAESDGVGHPIQGYKPLLLRGLREALEGAPETVVRWAAWRYVAHPYVVLRRLGIRLIGSHLEQCGELAEEVLSNRETVFDGSTWPEIYRLLEAGVGRLSAELRARLLEWISAGPSEALVERERKWYRESMHGDPPVEHMNAWGDRWILDHLWPLRNHDLPDEIRAQLDRLKTDRGAPTPPRRGAFSVSFAGVVSLKSKDELIEMGPAETVDYLRAYVPQPTDFPFDASREGLAQAFQEVVSEQPEQYVRIAPRFAAPGMRPIYAFHFLRGLEKAWESGKTFDWVPVFELIGEITHGEVASVQNQGGNSQDEPDWTSVDGQIASLLEEAVRRDEHALPSEHMEAARDVLLQLVNHPDPSAGAEARSTFDPATLAINSVRGRALQTLIMYALRHARLLEEQAPSALDGIAEAHLELTVREALTDRLDRGKEISRGVHSLFGKFLPQLRYLDRDWFEENLVRILPEEQDQEAYWQAAWSSYVAFNRLYAELYQILRNHYRRAIQGLSHDGEPKAGLENVRDRLAGHVLAAYWGGAETLDEDSLVALLYRVAPIEVRSNTVHMMQRWLNDCDEAARQEVWPRLQVLWEARTAAADAAPNPAEFRAEFSAYFGWLTGTPEVLGVLYPLIVRTLPHMQEGVYGDLLLEYLRKQATTYPMLAVHVLLQMMTMGAEPLRYKQDEVTNILTLAMKSDNSDAHADAIEVINLFGERGEYAYRGLLDL